MIITVAKGRGSTKTHIVYAEGGSPTCMWGVAIPAFAATKEYSVNIRETIWEKKLVLTTAQGDIYYDPEGLCKKCKKKLVARILRQSRVVTN